jgi:hypothetical protein
MNLGRTIKPITFCYNAVNSISEKCYSALHLNESRPHDRERMFLIACYNTLSAVTGATTEDPDQPLPRHCCCCCMPLGTGPLNLGTVAILPWIWIPLHRPIEIWQLRSSVCYSIMKLLQYYEQYFATVCTFRSMSATRLRMNHLDRTLQCYLYIYGGNAEEPDACLLRV